METLRFVLRFAG